MKRDFHSFAVFVVICVCLPVFQSKTRLREVRKICLKLRLVYVINVSVHENLGYTLHITWNK